MAVDTLARALISSVLANGGGGGGGSGQDGVGVANSVVKYQLGTSGTVAPTGTWSSTIPQIEAGQFLWTRVVINYTNGTNTTFYSVSMGGEKGDNAPTITSTELVEVKNEDGYSVNALNLIMSDGTEIPFTVKVQGATGGSGEAVIINLPETAMEGTLTSDQIQILQASDANYIVFNNEIYLLQDKEHDVGYLIYTHVGHTDKDTFMIKCITVTLNTGGWVLSSLTVKPETPYVIPLVPPDATQGTFTSDQMIVLQSNRDAYIMFDNERYDPMDYEHETGHATYTHIGHSSTDKFFIKCLTVAIPAGSWVLDVREVGTGGTGVSGSSFYTYPALSESFEENKEVILLMSVLGPNADKHAYLKDEGVMTDNGYLLVLAESKPYNDPGSITALMVKDINAAPAVGIKDVEIAPDTVNHAGITYKMTVTLTDDSEIFAGDFLIPHGSSTRLKKTVIPLNQIQKVGDFWQIIVEDVDIVDSSFVKIYPSDDVTLRQLADSAAPSLPMVQVGKIMINLIRQPIHSIALTYEIMEVLA